MDAFSCGQSFPSIETLSFERHKEYEPNGEPGWVDVLHGADVLTVPRDRTIGKASLVCPVCKRCVCSIHRGEEGGRED